MKKNKLITIRHGDDPPDDRVHSFALAMGLEPVVVKPFKGEPLDFDLSMVAGTVLYGGPHSVFETNKNPFLNDEAKWIETCLKQDIPILGICQGAQQIAYHLGAWAGPHKGGQHEFGYYEIHPANTGQTWLKESLTVCQAHFHTFDLPDGAQRVAGNEIFPNQAFAIGDNVLGVQFHPEVTIEGFRRWQNAKWANYGKPGAQTREEQSRLMHAHDAAMADWFGGVMRRLFSHQHPNE
ncbi:MAG: glutamine amidotransferase [Pseudomonadota bacterium]